MTHTDLKNYLTKENLISALGVLGYKVDRSGKFSLRGEKTPSTSINPKNLKMKDFGGDFSGDIFDLLKEFHGMSEFDAFKHVQNFLGLSDDPAPTAVKANIPTYAPPIEAKNDAEIMNNLKVNAARYLKAKELDGKGRERDRYQFLIQDIDGITKDVAILSTAFAKLFEQSSLEVDEKRIEYIFKKFVGYDSYFNCPVIILYDLQGNVINIIKYRPQKDGEVFMKYLYSKSEEIPNSTFLYPFQLEMERIMFNPMRGYAYVGEGLKNALVALVFGIPYISIQSTSSISVELLEYLQTLQKKAIFFIGAFDGDEAGKKAYEKVSSIIPMQNAFDFNSGLDFADYMKQGDK